VFDDPIIILIICVLFLVGSALPILPRIPGKKDLDEKNKKPH
jgi:hypothetical protein